MCHVHHAVGGASCYLGGMALYAKTLCLVSSDILGRLQERMQSNWWTQENMLASRCADEGVPIYVCSSDILRRAKDETLYVIK